MSKPGQKAYQAAGPSRTTKKGKAKTQATFCLYRMPSDSSPQIQIRLYAKELISTDDTYLGNHRALKTSKAGAHLGKEGATLLLVKGDLSQEARQGMMKGKSKP